MQTQNITAHNAGDVTITFDAIDAMPHIEIDPVTRRTRGLIANVSLSEEEIALLQSDPAASTPNIRISPSNRCISRVRLA
jgi:hypothetical protein